MNINQLIFEPLLTLDSNYKINNCLAIEYAKTSTKTYIVKINTDIKWSDGTNISSEDVKYTIELLKSFQNIYSENVKYISGVDAIDNSTIKITLSEEQSFFEYNLIFPIMNKKYYENEEFITSQKIPIGTGLYKIASIADNQIVLEKNQNYRDTSKQNKKIEKIYINIYNEMGEVYNSFKIGNIDIINTSSVLYEDYIGTIGYYVKEYKGREYDFLSCNCNDYLLKEKSVRQAISYAIDKENIISTVYNNEYYVSENMLDYGNYTYDYKSSIQYNPEKAKEILVADGWVYSNNRWSKNGTGLYINISVNSSNPKRVEVAKLIQAQLKNIGIQVNIKQLSDWQYNYCLENKNYQILLTGVYNAYSPDLTYFYGDNNLANYNNEEVKSLVAEIRNITDQKLIQDKYKKINSVTEEESAYISLYRNKNSLLISQKVIGDFVPTNYGTFKNFETWNRE